MVFKFFYSIIIIICSSLLGLIHAKAYVERSRLLKGFLSTLQMLETEIVYGATPLPDLMKKVGSKSKKEIKEIFFQVSDLLNHNSGASFDEIWSRAVVEKTRNTYFAREDVDLLLSLGKNLGISNCQDQVKHIRLVEEEIKRHYESALVEEGKNVKLFKNLGFLLGTAIVIILY